MFKKTLTLLLGLAGVAYAGPAGPPAGNYLLNVSTIAAKPAFNVSSGTVAGPLTVNGTFQVQNGTQFLQATAAGCNIAGVVTAGCGNNASATKITNSLSTSWLDTAGRLSLGGIGPNQFNVIGPASIKADTNYPLSTLAYWQIQPSTTVTYALLISTVGRVNAGNTIGISTNTEILLNGAAGTNGQVLTSGGLGVTPSWTTVSGGGSGGSSSLETMANGLRVSSPTASINLIAGTNVTLSGALTGGATAAITINATAGSTVLKSSGIAFGSPTDGVTSSTATFGFINSLNEQYIFTRTASQNASTVYNAVNGLQVGDAGSGGQFGCANANSSYVCATGELDISATTLSLSAFTIFMPNLGASAFMKTDASQDLIGYDLFGSANRWTGINTFTSSMTVSNSASVNGLSVGTTIQADQGQVVLNKAVTLNDIGIDSGPWTATGAQVKTLLDPGLIALSTADAMMVGGYAPENVALSSASYYTQATNAWTSIANMGTRRAFPSQIVLDNGEILVSGGNYDGSISTTSCEIYNRPANAWRQTGGMATARFTHGLVRLPNGKILAVGGATGAANTRLTSCELYDQTTGKWSAAGSMATARAHVQENIVLLPTGKVLVAGGSSQTNASLSSCELYDPTANTWSAGASLNTARQRGALVVLKNGMAMTLAGRNVSNVDIATAEIYNPFLDTWTTTANSMQTIRETFQAYVLPDGNVIAAGGTNLASAREVVPVDVYNPVSGQWIGPAGVLTGFTQGRTVMLANGQILTAAGYYGVSNTYNTTDSLYTPALAQASLQGNAYWDGRTGRMTFTNGLGAAADVSVGSATLASNLNVGGTMTGAGLSSCSGASNAVTWNNSTSLFGCNTITGGGGGGASTLEVMANGLRISSPTASINVVGNAAIKITGTLTGGATSQVAFSADPSSVTLQGVVTAASLGALTANQSITLSGDSTGSGATAITVTAGANQPNIKTLAASSTTVSGILAVSGFTQHASTITVPTSQGFTKGTLGVSWDGGGSALTAGTTYWLAVPSTGTITGFRFTLSPAGTASVSVSSSTVFDVTKAGRICASDCPTLTSGSVQTNDAISGWTTAVAQDGYLWFVINAAGLATATQADLAVKYQKL